ncbi:MAG: ABC transporter permease [Albidovulum sp.]|nr:ABC transporter permease [Albidovulum sp.]MDE0529939.1 ABC transporter permease [Albidovulum sp.]
MAFAEATETIERRSGLRTVLARVSVAPLIVKMAMAWLILVLFIAVTAHWIMPYDYQQTALLSRLLPPGATGPAGDFHILGTDHLGRDLLSRLFSSIQLTMLVAVFGTVFGAIVGSCIGFVAARFRGWVDDIIMVLVDFQASMPFVIIALSVIAVMGTGNMLLFILLVGFQGWERYARISRGMTLSAVNHGYAASIRLLGAGTMRVYLRHILPNILAALVVQVSINFPETVILETSMSFLGVGIQPPNTSLGNLLSYGRDYLLNAWWIAGVPGCAIFFTTLSMSVVGDWLRDELDPTTSSRA